MRWAAALDCPPADWAAAPSAGRDPGQDLRVRTDRWPWRAPGRRRETTSWPSFGVTSAASARPPASNKASAEFETKRVWPLIAAQTESASEITNWKTPSCSAPRLPSSSRVRTGKLSRLETSIATQYPLGRRVGRKHPRPWQWAPRRRAGPRPCGNSRRARRQPHHQRQQLLPRLHRPSPSSSTEHPGRRRSCLGQRSPGFPTRDALAVATGNECRFGWRGDDRCGNRRGCRRRGGPPAQAVQTSRTAVKVRRAAQERNACLDAVMMRQAPYDLSRWVPSPVGSGPRSRHKGI